MKINCFIFIWYICVKRPKYICIFLEFVFFLQSTCSLVCCIVLLSPLTQFSLFLEKQSPNKWWWQCKRGLLEGWRSASVSVCIISFNFHWLPWGGIVILYLTDADWVFDLSTCRWSWNTSNEGDVFSPGTFWVLMLCYISFIDLRFHLMVGQLIRTGGDEVSQWLNP